MYHLYILLCDKAFFYTGVTSNLEKRLREHLNGDSPYTKRYTSMELVYQETFRVRKGAECRETQIKGWTHEKKKALISGNFEKLRKLGKARS